MVIGFFSVIVRSVEVECEVCVVVDVVIFLKFVWSMVLKIDELFILFVRLLRVLL